MKVLIIGSGGREHALAWKLAQSPKVTEIWCAPGNAGTATEAKTRNVAIAVTDFAALIDFARKEQIALTVVGPEVPLVAGVVDSFEAAGLKCFGPRAAGAQLEGSKAFTKEFLSRHGIPTARLPDVHGLCRRARLRAHAHAADRHQSRRPRRRQRRDHRSDFGRCRANARPGAAPEAVRPKQARPSSIEDFLAGEEASFIAVVDGTRVVPLASSQDHKTRDDGDRGPNTGGMGAYSPAPVVTDAVHERVMREVMLPTVRGLAADGIYYRGFLYAGLMIDDAGQPRVIEFNCRLGDPETQPILFRLRSDLVDVCLQCFDDTLGDEPLEWDSRATVGVVMASRRLSGQLRQGQTDQRPRPGDR